ncbi:hypothetical protein ALC57_15504 [Trachymyrmex cornetzi]|uniref:Uncharacterized protein n=2 Tax=Trachymyrmex cornetzi TaxID=471704 RepID=A0A151IX33_9HYME|nr:hypothetical protein ALC57_15504 [Trachymyrmex cornetzi]
MSYESVQRWINEMMLKIIENLELDIHKAQYELLESTGNFIMSNIYHIRLKFENKTNRQSEELSIILKMPMLDFSQIARIDLQFRNEILFYQMHTRPNNYAKCFYVEERPPIDSIIALENVNGQGYYPCPYKYDSPVEYTLAAMRELGRFHGKGYVMKEMQREKFFDIAAQIQEIRFTNKTENLYKFACNIKISRVNKI